MAASIEDILGEITPRETTVPVRTRGDLDARIEQVEEQLKGLRSDSLADPAREALEAELADLVDQSPTRVFTIRSIGQRAWRDLLATHPPSEEQRRQFYDHDPDTFPYAAVAASVSDPVMTAEQAVELADRISLGQWVKLWNAVLAVNVGGETIPKSVTASGGPLRSGPSSTTAPSEESLDQSS